MQNKFIDMYERYFNDVYRYIYFKTGDKWETDDLTSDTFKKAFEKYDTSIQNAKAWLFTIARNCVYDYYRKRKDTLLDEDTPIPAAPDFMLEFEKKESLSLLQKALMQLTSEEAEIINLKYFANMKHRDIAALLNKSEDAVKMQSSRIIAKLKNILIKP